METVNVVQGTWTRCESFVPNITRLDKLVLIHADVFWLIFGFAVISMVVYFLTLSYRYDMYEAETKRVTAKQEYDVELLRMYYDNTEIDEEDDSI